MSFDIFVVQIIEAKQFNFFLSNRYLFKREYVKYLYYTYGETLIRIHLSLL